MCEVMNCVWVGAQDGRIYVFKSDTEELLKEFQAYGAALSCIAAAGGQVGGNPGARLASVRVLAVCTVAKPRCSVGTAPPR